METLVPQRSYCQQARKRHGCSDALQAALNEAADVPASGPEPRSTHPLEAHLNALPRPPLMPFDATGRVAAAIPFAFDDYLELVDRPGG